MQTAKGMSGCSDFFLVGCVCVFCFVFVIKTLVTFNNPNPAEVTIVWFVGP